MKLRFIPILILSAVIALCVCLPAGAERVNIDLETASYEEITDALSLLRAAQIEKLKAQFSSGYEPKAASGIMFKGIPWLLTRAEAEAVLGSRTNCSSYVYSSLGTVYTSGIGLCTEYKDWSCAGYPASSSKVNYVYPVLDGILIRDESLAMLYLAIYELRDIGNVSAAQDDLSHKLNKLYGDYKRENNDLIWTDADGNTITLSCASSKLSIMYRYFDTEALLSAADKAVSDEQALSEELNRIENGDNYDGL